MTGYDPHAHADELGLTVQHYPLRTCQGLYVPEERLILVRPRLRAAVERSIVAHEIGHHLLGHNTAQPGVWGIKQERHADLYAARALINPDRLRDLARATPDKGRWAIELGVSGDLLDTYLTTALPRAA